MSRHFADRIALGPISLKEALAIARQISEALEAAHEKGIIHRDLKPANIKMPAMGESEVLDFGLGNVGRRRTAYRSRTPRLTGTYIGSSLLGSPAYMSPEQAVVSRWTGGRTSGLGWCSAKCSRAAQRLREARHRHADRSCRARAGLAGAAGRHPA